LVQNQHLDHASAKNRDSKYYFETTNHGFSYFYYSNRSRSVLRETIAFTRLKNTELDSRDKIIDPVNTPDRVSFVLNPDCEEIVLLRNFDGMSDFDFLCYPEFESGQEIIVKYVKSIATCKPRLDPNGEENGVYNYLGKDKEKFYY
jgi:hypothetical protein